MQINLDIYGDPAPQGSKRVFNGRVVEAAGEKLKRWRREIARECLVARESNDVFFSGPVMVNVVFYMPRPKTISKDKRPWPTVPPDLDKLVRGLLDGIGQSEMIWGDDSQVVCLIADKVYADSREPGAFVTITGK